MPFLECLLICRSSSRRWIIRLLDKQISNFLFACSNLIFSFYLAISTTLDSSTALNYNSYNVSSLTILFKTSIMTSSTIIFAEPSSMKTKQLSVTSSSLLCKHNAEIFILSKYVVYFFKEKLTV